MSEDESESGEEQYLRWVTEVTGNAGDGSEGQPSTSPSNTGSASDSVAQQGDALAGTVVAERSVFPRPTVTLSQDHVTASPGQPVRVKATVRNVGPVVETYSLSSVGVGSAWVSLVPSELSLFPGDETSAAIVIKPPRSSRIQAQTYPVGIKATSEVDPNESTVAELSVTVEPFYESVLNVSRTTIEMARRASTYASVTNNGNTAIRVILRLWDPDGRLRLKADDSLIELAPGETVWTRVTLTGPFHLVGRQRTLSMLAAIEPNKDVTLGTPLKDMQSAVQRVIVIQRPLIRFRLGIIGRLVLLLAILGIIAAFVLSRISLSGSGDVVVAPPATPSDFTAEQLGTNQILLRWNSVPGATGYSIYAVGAAGNALSTPDSPTAIGAMTQATRPRMEYLTPGFVTAASFIPAAVGAGGGAGTSSPSPESTPTAPNASPTPSDTAPAQTQYEYDTESPSCGDCTHVGDVPSGTARFVVTKTKLGQQNCYRLVAKAGQTQSLFTPQMCVLMPTEAEVEEAKNAASAGDGTGESAEEAENVPCPPFKPMADKLSDTSLALTWMRPSETPEGEEVDSCDTNVQISGFEVQRQVFTGWSSVTPGPAASDTALEVQDLEPATRYCFRMRSTAGDQTSAYSETFCKKTKKAGPSPSPTLTEVPPDPAFMVTPSPAPSTDTSGSSDPTAAQESPTPTDRPSVESSPSPSPSETTVWSDPVTVPIP
ncbi:MAG: hypothetical protein O2815_08255 [Actinomycetota bacterium]|nr:hypothetical protein [Actinomycetota bacterium]